MNRDQLECLITGILISGLIQARPKGTTDLFFGFVSDEEIDTMENIALRITQRWTNT